MRHATIHAAGMLAPAQLKKLGPTRFKLLSKNFTGRQTASGYQPTFGSEEAREAIQTFASYALMIYKEASALEGLDFDSFKRRGAIRLF